MTSNLTAPSRRLLAVLALTLSVAACGSQATSSDADGGTASAGDGALDITIDQASGDRAVDPDSSTDDQAADAPATDDDHDGSGEDADQPLAALTGGDLAPEGARSNWTGTIDGRIGITMWLTQQGDIVRGELTYDSVGVPITIHGQTYPSGDGWLLREFADDGRVTGTLILGSVADGLIGDSSWGDVDLELVLAGLDSTSTSFDPLVRPGQYEYAFAPFPGEETCCGPTGSLRVTDVTSNSVTIEIENTTGAPGYNLAIVDPITIPLNDNVASYELSGDGADCAFDLEIFDGFVHVRHVDDRFDCFFGNAAGVEGMYVLTEPYVSADESPFADAVLTSNEFGGVRLGMTWAELSDQFGAPAFDPATAGIISEGCSYVKISSDPWSPWFMLLGDDENALVSRIELVSEGQTTDAGIGLGSTVGDIRAAYDEVTTSPHYYLGEGAEYVTVVDDDPDSTVLFETDEDGVVIAVRNGFDDPIRWIEGCA